MARNSTLLFGSVPSAIEGRTELVIFGRKDPIPSSARELEIDVLFVRLAGDATATLFAPDLVSAEYFGDS